MKKILLGVVLALGGLTACSPYKVVRSQAYLPVETVRGYRTFNFVETDLNGLSSVTPEQVERIEAAIARQLEARGYQRAATNPDLLVNAGLMITEKTQTRQTSFQEAPRYIGQRRYSWRSETIPVGTYNEGTLTIDVADARQNRLFWEGAVASVLTKKSGSDAELDKAMTRLFGKFPGRVGE